MRDCRLNLRNASKYALVRLRFPTWSHEGNLLCVLVIPPSSLPVYTAETCNHNAHSHLGFFLLLGSLLLCATTATTSSSRRLLVRRACDDAHDLCVSHLEVAGAIGGGLCADLRVAAAELVPAPAIDAEECEVVGGCVERHLCVALQRKFQRIIEAVFEGPISGGSEAGGICLDVVFLARVDVGVRK